MLIQSLARRAAWTAVITLLACTRSERDPARQPTTPIDLEGTEWVLLSLNGQPVVAGTRVSLEVERALGADRALVRAKADRFVRIGPLYMDFSYTLPREVAGRGMSKRILVVDDSATMRRMVIASLRTEDVEFDQAATGLEAIERLTLAPVDLVVLDLNMPDVHGLEVLRFIRTHQAFREIPVVVLTTRGDEESRAAALADGATLYLTKPFAPDTFAPHVRRLLQKGLNA